jgi:hypothetical protein
VGSNPTQPPEYYGPLASKFGTDTLDGESGEIPHHDPDGGSWNASADQVPLQQTSQRKKEKRRGFTRDGHFWWLVFFEIFGAHSD